MAACPFFCPAVTVLAADRSCRAKGHYAPLWARTVLVRAGNVAAANRSCRAKGHYAPLWACAVLDNAGNVAAVTRAGRTKGHYAPLGQSCARTKATLSGLRLMRNLALRNAPSRFG